tara:strand:+ start:131 stop:571 length:441 start_codon:yes stop_codon:yes gene_type:complete
MKKLLLTALTICSLNASATWVHKELIDPITDFDNSFAGTIVGSNSVIISCNGDEINFVFGFRYLGEANKIHVRFDKEKPFDVTGDISTSRKGIFVEVASIDDLILGMKKHKKMAVQTTDYRGSTLQEVYDLTGFTEQIKKLKCVKF